MVTANGTVICAVFKRFLQEQVTQVLAKAYDLLLYAAIMAALTLLRLPFAMLVYGICTVRSECLYKAFDIISQNLQYSANLTQIAPPCTRAGVK